MDRTITRRCIKYICALAVVVTASVSIAGVVTAHPGCIADGNAHITAAAAQDGAGSMSEITVSSQNELSDSIVNRLSLSTAGEPARGVLDANAIVAADAGVMEREASENVFAVTAGGNELMGSSLQKKEKTVTIDIDGSNIEVSSYADTVEGVLRDAGVSVGADDSVSPALTSSISSGDTIKIIRAVSVTVKVDGDTRTINTVPMTVAQMLDLNGIPVSEDDEITAPLSSTITNGEVISIGRITTKTETKFEKVKHDVRKIKDSSMKKGARKVVTRGRDGTANITYKIIYKYGKELKRTALKTDYVTKPRTEVVRVGTKKTASAGTRTFGYSEKYTMVATAYCDGGNTASGPACGEGIIAVDPSVIPLGTKVYVEGYGYALAADTGGYIKGSRIDLWMSSNSLCEQWGRRTVTMYVLD